MPFLLQFLLTFHHFVFDLLFIGVRLEFVQLLLCLDQFLLVLLNQLSLLFMEVVMQLHVQLLDQVVQTGLRLLDVLQSVTVA